MHFKLISGDDLAVIIESSTVTRRVSERIDAFEAMHPVIGRLLVTVDAISGDATVASDRPLADHLVSYSRLRAADQTTDNTKSPIESYRNITKSVNIGRPQQREVRTKP